ncbi:unnamed protein product [Sphagnum balticum]
MPTLRMMSHVPLAMSVVCMVLVWLSSAGVAARSPARIVNDLFSSSLFEQQRDPIKSSQNYQNTDGQFTPLSLEQFLADAMDATRRRVGEHHFTTASNFVQAQPATRHRSLFTDDYEEDEATDAVPAATRSEYVKTNVPSAKGQAKEEATFILAELLARLLKEREDRRRAGHGIVSV